MGGSLSTLESPKKIYARRKSSNLIKKKDTEVESKKTKILLLGVGESGKSTLFKQFQIIYGVLRSEENRKVYAFIVRNNVTVLIKRLFPLVVSLGLEAKFEPHERAAYHKILDGIASDDVDLPVTLPEEIRTVFRSLTFASVWARRSTVHAIDSHRLFIDELAAIAAPDYVPTVQHLVNARVRTTHPRHEAYDIRGRRYEIYDVGGHRSERKKWVALFDDVQALVFVAALSDYDQQLQEDRRVNRMAEAIGLFRTLVNHEAFANVPVVLLLNKKDLFEEKLFRSKIQEQEEFSDYSGNSYEEATEYFKQKFGECFETPEEDWKDRLFVHSIDATDTKNVKSIWKQKLF